jgi:hypothetical protein
MDARIENKLLQEQLLQERRRRNKENYKFRK